MTNGWSTAGFADVAELVRESTGLVFPESRFYDVEATIRRTMSRLRISGAGELVELLRTDAAARESFVADLTIGESYFQRDPSQFELLRRRILPELLRAHPRDRPLRVWSAGCATGEEPYTIAMLFEEMDAADRSDIVGTDIARNRLAEAQRGLYSKWQLRNTPETVRRRYFAAHGKYFELTPRIRQRVDFRYLNLAEDSFPSLTAGIWGMDVILCRNVLIYFDAPTVERAARRLVASLSEDGWLLLGASDPAISDMVECDVVLTDSGLVYRRKGAAASEDIRVAAEGAQRGVSPARLQTRTAESSSTAQVDSTASGTHGQRTGDSLDEGAAAAADPFEDMHVAQTSDGYLPPATAQDAIEERSEGVGPAAATEDVDGTIVEAYERRDFVRVQELATAAAARGSLGTAAWTAWVRALANEGRHEEAAATVTRAMERTGATPELLYLHAVLLLQAGHPGDAAAAARRALYMDRTLVVAHLTLGEAQRRTGNLDGARRALRNAASLLAAIPAETTVPASDGEAAGRLAELVRVKLNLLGG